MSVKTRSYVTRLGMLLPLAVGLTSASAYAQTPTPPAPSGSATPAAPSGAPPSPLAGESSTAPSSPTNPGDTTAPPPPVVPAPEAAKAKWYDSVNLGAFVDSYYSLNWKNVRPNTGANLYQPYTANSGLSLAWVGLDASVEPEPVGAVMQLRFGPGVPNLALGDFNIPGGIGFVQNGYVVWKPQGKDGKIKLIAGKFDTVYGAEVAQSQLNINYTRGFLYNLAQPFFHTGFRADVQLSDLVAFKVLAVNGWNNTIDNNHGKSFGTQLTLTPTKDMSFALGYMGGPEEADVLTLTCASPTIYNGGTRSCIAPPPGVTTPTSGPIANVGADSRWRHLVDLVADVNVTPSFRVVVNGDYVTQAVANPAGGSDNSVSWFGAALLARYALSDVWGLGARGEIIRDKDGQISAPNTSPLTLYTGTLTLEAAPHKMLLIRLDNRVDAADADVFPKGRGDTTSTQFTTTLGVVAKTN